MLSASSLWWFRKFDATVVWPNESYDLDATQATNVLLRSNSSIIVLYTLLGIRVDWIIGWQTSSWCYINKLWTYTLDHHWKEAYVEWWICWDKKIGGLEMAYRTSANWFLVVALPFINFLCNQFNNKQFIWAFYHVGVIMSEDYLLVLVPESKSSSWMGLTAQR